MEWLKARQRHQHTWMLSSMQHTVSTTLTSPSTSVRIVCWSGSCSSSLHIVVFICRSCLLSRFVPSVRLPRINSAEQSPMPPAAVDERQGFQRSKNCSPPMITPRARYRELLKVLPPAMLPQSRGRGKIKLC